MCIWVHLTEAPAQVHLLGMVQQGSARIRGLVLDPGLWCLRYLIDRPFLGEGGSFLETTDGNCRETRQRDSLGFYHQGTYRLC